MLPLPRGAVWQLLFLFCAALYINGVRSDGRVVCYYTNWSVYRPGTAKFNPQNINPYLCTHLIYAFGGFTKDNQMKPFDKYQDIEQGGYAKFTGLKTYNKQLKTMIAIGGWNEASSRFSPLVANPERRQKFIKNILKFLRQNHFDGIDLDWEYPAHREGGKSRDRDNYAQFVQELRAEFERESEKTGRPRLLLTMAVPAGIEYIEKGYDIPKLNKYLDWFNLLTYDFHSSHEPSVNHHAPLYSLEEESEYNYDAELNIDYSIKFYLNAGADRDKLVLGIPTYGRSYTLINEESTEIGAPAEAPGEQGDATREKGYLAYYEICQNIKEDPEWTVVQPNPNAMGPYAYRRNQWVGYDDEAIVRKKAQYVVDNGLGGIMFWAIDNDDFRGICTGKQYPLIEAAKEAMLDALGFGINEVSKPSAPQKPSRSRSRENSASTRNRITTTEHKLTYAERKGSTKRVQTVQQSSTRSKQQPSTTEAPIKLTEVEGSSLYIGGRTTTPPPPTTPDPGTDFKCEEEGFFQHPRDCKKYYWCLDSGPSGLGIVAHQFTCPSGLYFNPAADSCDFARNVPCKTKKSTTAAPITTPATTTTTTPRPNRLTAATSRPTTFFRTTPRTTTTTTTEASEEDIEYEEEENSAPSPFAKRKGSDKDAEEDPKVIKELIELIRKVGGIEELEKHLLRKEDGTISIKENSSSSSSSSLTATTPSTISKSLYEKVLSKPNALNSFRNRFTSTSSFRTTKTQTKTQDNAAAEVEIEESLETDSKSSGATTGFSKYSSVLRGNSRQGPQNEGISKLSEFDGFLKEKKQYITINRNRGTKKTSDVEEDEEVEEEVSKTKSDSLTQDEEEEYDVKTTRKVFSSATPSYSTIRRTRPPTTTEANNDEAEDAEEKEVTERKSYSTLNRSRSRATTTTETPDVVEVTAGSTRYKYLERTRPTRPTTESSSKIAEEEDTDNAEVEDDDEAKNKENTVHFKAVNIDNTRETQQQEITINTQRAYASIGRRTTTSTPDTETTTAGAAKTSTTTTAAPTTTTSSTTETPITTPLTIIETTTPDSLLITTNIPITTTTNPTTISTTTTTITTTTTKTTTLPNGEDVLGTPSTTPVPNEINSDISETLDSSLHLNSLLTESSTSSTTPTPTTESGLDTNEQEIDSHSTTTEATISSTTATVLNGNDKLTKTADTKEHEEVNLVSKQRNKTLYNTRTRTTSTTTKTLPTITTTTTNSDIETTTTTSPTNAKKTLGVRRQQQVLLNRSSQTKTITTDTPNPTTESVNNDFLGTVSSPRPFGFPKRRTRPSINAAGTTTTSAIPNTTDEEVVKSTEESLITKQKASTKLNAAANSQTKVSSHNTILSETTTTTTTNVHDAQTSSQQELLTQQDESEVTSTEHLNSKDTKVESLNQHVVVAINGSEGINDSLRHVNNIVLNLNNSNSNSNSNNSAQTIIKTHTLVQEVDDDDENKNLYSWHDARQPTKPTPKQNKLIVTEVTTEERVSQKVSPDHVTAVNVLETNDKIERLSNKNEKQDELFKETGKYRGKSLETEENYDYNQVDGEDEGRAFKTYTTINRRRQQTKSTTGIEEDGNVVNNFRVTEVVKSGSEHELENENKNDASSVNNKFKYSTITRGQNSKTETVEANEHESEGSGLNIKTKYSSITRGQTSKSETEQGNDNESSGLNIKTKYSSITRGQTSKSETEQGNDNESSGLNIKTKYSSITRGQTSKSETEQGNEHDNLSSGLNIKSIYSSTTRGQTSKTETDLENEHESESSGLNVKSKYSSINRGQISKTETVQENNHENENATRNIKYSKYSSVNRGQTLYKGTEENESENSSFNNSLVNRGQTVYKGTDQNESENSSLNNKFEYSSVTRGQSSKTGTEQENEHESESSGLNVKSKYSSVSRGQTLYKGTEANESENSSLNNKFEYSSVTRGQSSKTGTEQEHEHESESSGLNVKSKYSSVSRGQTLYKGTEGNESENSSLNNKFEYSSVTRGQLSKTETEQEHEHESESSGLNVKSKYSSVNRGQTLYKGTEANESENSSLNNSSVNRGQTLYKGTEGNESENSSLNNKFEYSSVTRGQLSKTETEQENAHESESSGLNIKSKYSSINRGQTLYKGTEENESENSSLNNSSVNRGQTVYKGTEENESENSGLNTKSKYSSVTRGQTSKSETEKGNEHDNESSGLNVKSKYSSITRGQTSKSETEQENEHENESSGLNVKSKYSSVNRGETVYKGTEQNESENSSLNNKFEHSSINRGQSSKTGTEHGNEHDNESSSLNNKFKYSSITRGQTSKSETEQENEHENESLGLNIKTKYSSTTRGNTDSTNQSKFQYTAVSQEQNSGIVSEENNTANVHSDTTETNGEKKTYTTITRNRGTLTSTENIPYKAIVRDNGGVQLTEDQLSGFIKNAGEEITRKTYQAISRGGQVLQSENTEINEKDHYHINALNTLGLTEIESNRNANKGDATIEDNATTEKLSTLEASTTTTTTTTTEEPTTASVLENTSSTEEVETTTVPTTTTTTTTTTPEATTRRSFFKTRVTTATSNADSETDVEKSVRKGTFNANTQVKKEEETTTLIGRRRTVYKRPTVTTQLSDKQESNSQNTKETKEKTETQTNFRRRTILRKKPTVTVQTETEVDETKQKFDRGSLISLESESSQDGIETSTLTNLPRATYRPKEKGDLSSLLALDLAKKSGNKATLTFGNGKRRRPGQSGLQVSETEDDSETNVRITGSASDELVSNGESITTATRKRIFGSQGVKSNTEIKGEIASQVADNRSKFTFGSAGKISTETDNANNLAANGQQSTTQSVNGRRRVIVRKRIQSGQGLRSQNANKVESSLVSNIDINNTESTVNQNGQSQIGLSNGRFSSSTSKSDSNSESESAGIETEDSKAVIEGEIKNDAASEVSLKDAKVTGTEKKFSYNSFNRKNAYANRRVVGSQTAEDSENTESLVRTSNRETLNKERNSVNSVRSQSQDSSRKSAYVNRRGSLNKNNHETTEEVEILEDGSKRIKTTFYETVNTGGQVKIIKRTKIKTIIKQEPEYVDETEDITPTTTTRRPLRSRGSAKFHTDDLSSLLALDFASKSNRHEQNDKSLTKHRRKLIRKPVIIKEEEHVEEIIEDLPTRPTRLPTITETSQIVSNRIRPTRPTTTETNLTLNEESDNGIKVEEKSVLSTTNRKFGIRRPTNVATKSTLQSTIVNETVDKDDTTSTTRRKFAFKRPINTVKTVKTTEQVTNVTSQTSAESANVNNAEGKDFTTTRRKFAFKRPLGTAQTITNTEQVTKTIITQTEQTNGNVVGGNKFINRFKSKSVTANKDEETTTGPLPTVSIVTESVTLETTNPVLSTEHTTENLLQNQEPVNSLKTHLATAVSNLKTETKEKSDEITNGLANVVNTLKTATEIETEAKTNILKGKGFTKDIAPNLADMVSELKTQAEKVTETEVADAIEMKNEIISGKAFGQDLSLPIYYRRKYYQYYKDSPITYISPATARSETQQTVNVDQQIHDVFNVSNEHLHENQNNDEVLAVKAVEQAQQINSELSHFLLKTPGSK